MKSKPHPSRNWSVAPPPPFHYELDRFLAGDCQREIEINRIFGYSLDNILSSYRAADFRFGNIVRSIFVPGFAFRSVETDRDHGIMLLKPNGKIGGAYLGGALAILPECRGYGLGAELVFEFATEYGVLPAWFLDVPAYTLAGYGAHVRAWNLAHDPEFLRRKNA